MTAQGSDVGRRLDLGSLRGSFGEVLDAVIGPDRPGDQVEVEGAAIQSLAAAMTSRAQSTSLLARLSASVASARLDRLD